MAGTSFKNNMDPFGLSNEEQCRIVLEKVKLWSVVCQDGGLGT